MPHEASCPDVQEVGARSMGGGGGVIDMGWGEDPVPKLKKRYL